MSSFLPSGWKWDEMGTINGELKDEDLRPDTARDEPSSCTSSRWGIRKQAASYFKVSVTQEGVAECWMDEQRNEGEQKKKTKDRGRCYRGTERTEETEGKRGNTKKYIVFFCLFCFFLEIHCLMSSLPHWIRGRAWGHLSHHWVPSTGLGPVQKSVYVTLHFWHGASHRCQLCALGEQDPITWSHQADSRRRNQPSDWPVVFFLI